MIQLEAVLASVIIASVISGLSFMVYAGIIRRNHLSPADLEHENLRLASRVVALEEEVGRLREAAKMVEALKAHAEQLIHDNLKLHQEIGALKSQLDYAEHQTVTLRRQLGQTP